MADRREPVRKTPKEILEDMMEGHREASTRGPADGQKYLQNFLQKYNSIPNAVKFFIYDLLVEDAYQSDNLPACREAVGQAINYLPDAIQDATRSYQDYTPAIHCFERGISMAVNNGEFEKALHLCDEAIKNNLGKIYQIKKESIEGMV